MTRIEVVTVGTQGPAGPASLTPGAVLTTEGDLIIGGSGGTPIRLAKGTGTQELAIVSNRPAWRAKPLFHVKDIGTTNTAFNTTLDAAGWDTGRTGAASLQSGGHVYLASGDYTIAAEVSTNNTWWGRISGERSTILRPTAALDSILYLDGNSFFELDHLRLSEPGRVAGSGHLVQDAVRIDRTDAALNSVHDSHSHHIDIIDLDFVRAVSVGENSGINDLAQMYFSEYEIYGDWTAGETTKWQEGFHFGSGDYGNVLNFSLENTGIARVRRPVYIDNTNAQLRNVNIGYAEAGAYGNPRFDFSWDKFYVETTDRLLHFPGVDAYPRPMTARNGIFSANGNLSDCINIDRAGDLLLEAVTWYNGFYPTVKAQIKASATYGRKITLRTFSAFESPEEILHADCPWQSTWLELDNYTHMDISTGLPIRRWKSYVRTVDGSTTEKLQYMPYDGLLIMDTSVFGFAQPVYLPLAAHQAGRICTIQRKGAQNVTITATGSDNIGFGSATTLALTADGQTARLISDGVKWIVV